jgi:hypothetical protein
MSHQEAKATAQQVIRDLLAKHPPGFVVMVIRALNKIQRASKDITIYGEKTQATPPQNTTTPKGSGSGMYIWNITTSDDLT